MAAWPFREIDINEKIDHLAEDLKEKIKLIQTQNNQTKNELLELKKEISDLIKIIKTQPRCPDCPLLTNNRLIEERLPEIIEKK